MERQSSLENKSTENLNFNKEEFSMLKLATVLLPSSDFVTLVNQFPGGNAVEYWHAKGNFFITFTVYVDGKEIGKIHSNYVNQEGCIQVDFDDLLKFHNPTSSGIIIADYYHHKKIPIELYFANIHKKTGTYLAYPGQSFMGDQIYPIAHTEELENSLFWPGATINDRTKISIISINPYKASSFIQLHLFLPNGKREQSKTIKLKAFFVFRVVN